MTSTILVTGGAGYIGSHMVRQLGERGHDVIVLDNLYSGFRELITHGTLIEGNTGDQKLVSKILADHDIKTVLHFAAHTIVPESVSNPLKYYGNNTANTRALLECCVDAGVGQFIFSSTAAVYGEPANEAGLATVGDPTSPATPYGASKLMTEQMLADVAAATDLRYVVLRYFNVAGSDPEGRIGHSLMNATLLVKAACQHAAGLRPDISVFGSDYPTHDGTGVRDYIHVEDLANAHLCAMDYLNNGGDSTTLNCGYGHGYSVREVLDMVAKVSGKKLNILEQPRRPGDLPQVVSVAGEIRERLGWQPQYDDLEEIVRSAYAWEEKIASGEVGFARAL